MFPVLLADRESAFLDFASIKTNLDGIRHTCMFYCNPVKPGQKNACEKNYIEFRKILPKGTDVDALTQWDVAMTYSHVNSYMRASQRVAPIALASLVLPKDLLDKPRYRRRPARQCCDDVEAT